ncbi:MAG: sigma-54 dependent transcriptional regulator [Melioribacteraceae bacterium]|nr:transcriptional regulator [Ignavibacteriota bacterium]MBZ0184529.1 sigma-54 dependent transcriptional regulator [Melioribacteraceae bacterium]
MRNKIKILLIEDEEFDVKRVKNTIKLFENSIEIGGIVSSGSDALNLINESPEKYDIIVMDYQIAGALRGEELIRKIKEINSVLQIIVITKLTINISDFDFAKNLMQAGAFWYCTKYPGDIEDYIYQPTDFIMSIFNAYDKKRLEMQSYQSNKKLNQNIEEILEKRKIISSSVPMEKLKQTINRLAESEMNIMIIGASGTGKELVANNIHYRSKRKFENFVPINCGSIPHDLIESELFGYEKGAFTGANTSKAGLFEIADRGTLFLDEIAELPLSAQVKLLRVIQEGEIEKIGRTKRIKVDVRIIAATNKNLENEIEAGRFREDLYYRLNVVPVFVLPLKERREDIPTLINHFVEVYSYDMGKPILSIDDNVMEKLANYDWPGNVRELKNLAQRLVFNSNIRINITNLEEALFGKSLNSVKSENSISFSNSSDIKQLKVIEKEFREKYFKFVRNNSESDAEAAQKLGLAPPNYHRMCKELGIK